MFRIILFAIFFVLISVNNALAAATDWHKTDEASVRLIAGQYKEKAELGLQFKLAKGWHTYWRTPGDGGMPLNIDWSKSENVKDLEIKWPAPERFVQFETIETYAYKGEVVLPIVVTPIDASKPVNIDIATNYAVCEEICLFLNSDFNLKIEPNHYSANEASLINKSITNLPGKSGERGLTIESVTAHSGNNLEVKIVKSDSSFIDPDVFIEASEDFRFPKADISFSEGRKQAEFKIPYEVLLEGESLAGKTLKLTLVDEAYAVEKEVRIDSVPNGHGVYFLYILLTAFIGGLILNIMPCVFPVLSLKLIGVIKHGGSHISHIRSSFLMSSVGIVFSFLVLAAIAISLKSLGMAVGWGFHFQEPIFLIAVIIVLNFFAANQWGMFEIIFPASWGGKLQADSYTPLGNFLTGAFATLLATPCSAPFLGTAVSFALARDMVEILTIFFFMGLGMSFPYLLFAFAPHLVSKLPKPGVWMVKMKYFLGLLLIATSFWLIWVLSGQLGILSAVVLVAISLLIFILLIIHQNRSKKTTTALLIVGAIFLSFILPVEVSERVDNDIAYEDVWQNFDRKKIPELVKQGKVVFVDVTADWCLTCKFNKFMVLDTDTMLKYLNDPNIIAMKADYTSPSKEIADYLRSFNRYGIPFNVVYGPNAPRGITLSELLTKDAVIEAIEMARDQ